MQSAQKSLITWVKSEDWVMIDLEAVLSILVLILQTNDRQFVLFSKEKLQNLKSENQCNVRQKIVSFSV